MFDQWSNGWWVVKWLMDGQNVRRPGEPPQAKPQLRGAGEGKRVQVSSGQMADQWSNG